jgi:rhodanese-related sulfurtransferase
MQANKAQTRRGSVAAIIVLGTAVPLVIYWILLARAATVTPWQAKELLRQPDTTAVLVDIRLRGDFTAGHLDGAVNWPHDQLAAATGAQDVPPALRDKTLLLIDDVGWNSLFVTHKLRRSGVLDARSVRGGIQEWIRSVPRQSTDKFDCWRAGDGEVGNLPFRDPERVNEIVSVTAFFVVKPIYTLLALIVIVLLWREASSDLAALRWGMIFFFISENACALNVLGFQETSYQLEYLHSAGMAICLGFVAHALVAGVDLRVIGLSAPEQRCAVMRLCGTCIKQADVPCGLRRLFTMLIPLLIMVAWMLPTADWQDTAYNTTVFGQFYPYGHLHVFQLYENWVCAAAAVLFLVIALVLVQFPGIPALHRAQIMFAAGVGPLSFGLLRVTMGGLYSDEKVWFGFWEEMTELLLLSGICFTLWTFRAQLSLFRHICQ